MKVFIRVRALDGKKAFGSPETVLPDAEHYGVTLKGAEVIVVCLEAEPALSRAIELFRPHSVASVSHREPSDSR